MKTIVTVTAIDNHWKDGKLTFTDSHQVGRGSSLVIEQDVVKIDGKAVLRRTPAQHERAHDHPWRTIGKDERLWSSYTIDVDIQP
jgi:hypothetical protein